MSYCVNCGVELEKSLQECPLCHTPVINPVEQNKALPPSPYPTNKGQVEVVKRKDLGILLSVVLSATSITCLLLNLLVFDSSLWSLAVIGCCICLFVFTFPAIFYSRTPIYISLLADGVSVAVYLYLISFLSSSHVWFWQLGLPLVAILTVCAECFPLLSRFFPLTILSGSLLTEPGFLPAYHMNKTNWISVLLDETVPDEKIFPLLDLSYDSVAPKRRKKSSLTTEGGSV